MGDNVEKFRCHASYMRAAAHCFGFSPLPQDQRVLRAFRAHVLASRAMEIAPMGDPIRDGVYASLANAWGSEMLLNVNGRFAGRSGDLLALSNNWAAVQVYYVAYHAFQSLLQARGQKRPEAHGKTQTMWIDWWVDQVRDVSPLSLAVGAGAKPLNFAAKPNLKLNPWHTATPSNCESIVGVACRTTREDRIEEKFTSMRIDKSKRRQREWDASQRERVAAGKRPLKEKVIPAKSQLTNGEKDKAEGGIRAYSTFDYLYRVRVRTNYVDSEMFTEGPESDGDSYAVHRDMSRIASGVLMAHEEVVAQLVGERRFQKWARGWIKATAPIGFDYGIVKRLELRPALLPKGRSKADAVRGG